MTDGPAAPALPDAPPPTPTRRRRRWPWVLLGVLASLLAVLAYLPALLGGPLLARFGPALGVQADSVRGPLWAPQLGGVTFQQPGVQVNVGSVGVTVASVDPFTRTVRLNVRAADATVNLRLKDLLSGAGGAAGGGGGGWRVLLAGVDVQGARVNVNGTGANIPDGQFTVQTGEDGRLGVRGRTTDGTLQADVRVREGAAGNVVAVDFTADATVLNHYWPGVAGGQLAGRYVLGDGPLRGDLKIKDGALRVPEAKFVTVTGIAGTATHRGDSVTLNLSGRGWGGPVTARGGVDLKAEHWTVTADATPTVSGLAGSLGTTGKGDLKLRVTAGGWSTVRVKAFVQGAGEVAGVGFSDANAEYTFLSENGNVAGQTNDVAFSANTALAGSAQKLEGRWAFGRRGQATLLGVFGQKPLDVNATIDGRNVLTLNGRALGGPLAGTLALSGTRIDARLNPTYGAAGAHVDLTGTPEDLKAVITRGVAGPFPLAGVVRLNRQGLQADLGTVRLDLNRSFRGSWQATNLRGAGVTLSGAGQLDLTGGGVTGRLSAQVPGVAQTLSGPLDVNYVRQRGEFVAGAQRLTWNGDAFGLRARNLPVTGGFGVSGDATVTNTLKLFGTLTASGNGYGLTLTGSGRTARLRGVANGVTVLATTELSSPYNTVARVQGTDIQGALSLDGNAVRFTLVTAGDTARGVIAGQDWTATGRVNLAALRPLVGVKDLTGTVDLNLAGQGGGALVRAGALGALVQGTVTRAGGPFTANLKVAYGQVAARLAGRIYPDVQASGTVSAQGQTLRATLTGPYSNLRASAVGRTGELSFSGVTVPAQGVNVQGQLTPKLALSGRWGDLGVTYDGATGLARVSGVQRLTAFGQDGQVRGRATWGPGPAGSFLGAVDARGVLDQYTVAVQGPWRNLNVLLTDAEGLHAQGRASLPEGRYDLNVRGPVAGGTRAGGLDVVGNIQGRGAQPRGHLNVLDGRGGSATVDLRGFQDFDVQARGLTLAGQQLRGTLTARNNVLNGALSAGPLQVTAVNGLIRARGVLAGQQVSASGHVTLPATVRDLNLRVDGPYFTASARGGVADLRGQLTIKRQVLGQDPARLTVLAQSFPVQGSLTGLRAQVGGLVYRGGRYSGGLNARYDLSGRGGTVRVEGTGPGLAAVPSGPVAGRLTLTPTLGGTLSANLSPFTSLLPAALRPEVVAGVLVAQVTPTGAALSTRGARYLGDPLAVQARVSWRQGFMAAGTLTHPGTRLPVRYDGRNLTVSGALLNARALRPLLPGATGEATLNLSVPGSAFARATGQARVNISAQGQRAVGLVTLSAGQLSANLTSTLSGIAVRVVGPLYPRADAQLAVDGVRATLVGAAEGILTLRASGSYAKTPLDVTATATGLTRGAANAALRGVVSGAAFTLNVQQGRGSGLNAWRTAGTVSVADLRALTGGTAGRVTATVGGTLADLRLNARGEVAGVTFTAPASLRNMQVRVQGAAAHLAQGDVRASGLLYPTLNLSARATLTDVLPGAYTAQVRGTYQKPDVSVQGRLTRAVAGLQAQGTALSARLLGRDWRAEFRGAPLTGTARGQLNANALGGLLDARLTLHAPYRSGDIDVRLDGQPGWNARYGFSGHLRAVGDVPGGPLDAMLDGQGALKLAALLGTGARQARVTGTLPATVPFRPGGTLDLAAFDVGALWGRADQLRLSGQATVGGRSWSAPDATFAGRVLDQAGELSGDLGATYRAGDLSVRLAGPQVAGGGVLRAGRYDLSLRAQPLHLARLLPAGAGVDALTFGGTVSASGTLAGGPQRVDVRNLALRGQQAQVGPFSLYGSATLAPGLAGRQGTLDAALSGSVRGGLISAQGRLPDGVTVRVQHVDTAYAGAASLGAGQLDGSVTLRGALTDPSLAGNATLGTAAFDAALALSGRVRDPRADARVSLKGSAKGTVYVQARDLNVPAGQVRARVYGTVQSGGNRASLDLSGVWPALAGQVQATLAGRAGPYTLTGDGRGAYALDAGDIGTAALNLRRTAGFVPDLQGSLDLTPLPLVGGSGDARVSGALGGTLTAPTLAATVTARQVTLGGVTLADTTGTLSGTLAGLTGTFLQGGVKVAALQGSALTLSSLRARAAGSDLQLSGAATLDGTADVNVTASGTLEGQVHATYRARALDVQGSLSGPQALTAALDVQADPFTGWHGTVNLDGGPAGVLTQAGQFRLSGALAHPLLTGEAGLLGAGARVVASARDVQVRLVDGAGATGSGVLSVQPDAQGAWTWSGAASLSRPELSLSVTPSGPLADPTLLLTVRRGEWRASGVASLSRADLNLTDGERSGTVMWQSNTLSANLPGLSLARLGIGGVSGVVTASGRISTETQDGQVRLDVRNLNTPYELPYVGVALSGEVNANVTLRGGRPTVQALLNLPAGTLNLSALQGPDHWTGRVTGTIAREKGALDVNVGADSGGLTGTATARALPVDVAGQRLTVTGTLTLAGQGFQAALKATNDLGQATVDASGGIADLVPALEGVLAVRPTGDGYAVRAALDGLEIRDLKIAPELSGRISGEANFSDGGGTFTLSSEALQIGPKTVRARVAGTQVSGAWRIQGYLGDSSFTAGLSDGEVFGQGTLRALPLGAVIGAFAGTTPGEGVVTGVVRFRFPLANPTAGTATIVAERIRVTATSGEGAAAVTETLTGSGTADLARGEVRNINVQLSGAGTWDVRGQYTRERVDLTAQFTNTTFTPVLVLVPALADLNPSLKGSVTLTAAGTYERPRALLRVQNVSGTIAGLSLQVPAFTGDLPDSGAFTGSGQVLTGGSVGSNGTLNVRGQLTLGKLSGTSVTFAGLLAPQALGALPNTTAAITQTGPSTWMLDVQSRSVNPTTGPGTMSLTGTLSPAWNLTLTARNYNLPLNVIYGRESALTADLRAVDDGTLIRVTGAADFQRITLGRVDAPATIPAPGQSSAASGSAPRRATDSYASPLPEQYTTFPKATQPGEVAAPRARPFLERLVLEDIPIRASNGIRVDESLIRAEFTGNLTLSGTGAQPRMAGTLRSQRGFVYLRDNEFTLADSTVAFTGENLFPKVNITANGVVPSSSTNQRVPVTLNLLADFVPRATGETVLNLKTTLSCTVQDASCADPGTGTAYNEAALYALVVTGVPNLTSLPDNLSTLGSSALQTALNIFVLGEFERTIAKSLGLDVFRFTPQLDAATGNVSATLTLGSYVSRNLYIQYQVDLTGNGLLDATYSTPDNRFTFKVSTPLSGLNLTSVRPSFSAAYNVNVRTSVSIGVQTTENSTKLRFGVTYRIGAR